MDVGKEREQERKLFRRTSCESVFAITESRAELQTPSGFWNLNESTGENRIKNV
jgi:hypothetical protein